MSGPSRAEWTELYSETLDSDACLMPTDPLPFVDEIEAILSEESCERVLEAAAGEGRNTQRLAETVSEYHACDISADALKTCKRRAGSQATIREADIRSLPYTSPFGATILLDALTHFRDVELVLRELQRVTETGGYVIFNMPIDGDDAATNGELIADYGPLCEYEYRNDNYSTTYMFISNYRQFCELLSSLQLPIDCVSSWEWRDPPHPEYRNETHDHKNLLLYARVTDARGN
ncbi:class I SAM-dependent methyltransferase [Halocatena halophila]|uniref:class I SAM-dependent methyltransferase n=1 Tax=Halocatena halophila TaxID=2814576 RepID=UPI002ED0737F